MPFFSIIIPTYNRQVALSKAILSVLSQSFVDFEILVMDDGSSDNTSNFVNSLNDDRIIYEWNKNTGGPANPRNLGIAKARGEWICFLDADDYWLSDKLLICFNEIIKFRDVDFLFHDLYLDNGKPNLILKPKLVGRNLSNPVIVDLLINGNPISTSSVLVRNSILKGTRGFDESTNIIAAEDFKLWLEIATITNKFKYLNRSLGYYVDLGGGISNKNMSFVYNNAITPFLGYLNLMQANRAFTFPKYINSKYKLSHNDFNNCYSDLIFCLKYAKVEIKIKSLFLLGVLFFMKIKYSFFDGN